jgi:hypothetical protein
MGNERATKQFWNSAFGRKEADGVLELKSQRGKRRKATEWLSATHPRLSKRIGKKAQPTIKYWWLCWFVQGPREAWNFTCRSGYGIPSWTRILRMTSGERKRTILRIER